MISHRKCCERVSYGLKGPGNPSFGRNHDDDWFSVYPPGWPLFWSIGLKLGLKNLINPIIAAVAFALILNRAMKDWGNRVAVFTAVYCMISPFFVLTAAAYYSHNTCLLCMAIFWHACLKWKQGAEGIWPITAALSLSYGLATRYLTMAAFATPFLIHLFIYCPETKLTAKKKNNWYIFFALVLTTQIFHLFYNYKITGNPFNPPNHYLHSHERLGFILSYTPWTSLVYLGSRVLYLMDWTPPCLVILFFLSVWAKPTNTDHKILNYSVLSVPLAYMLYYSWGGNQYGPRYYFEIYPWLVMTVCLFLFKQSAGNTPKISFKYFKAALSLLMVFAGLPILTRQLTWAKTMTGERKALYELAEAKTKKPALVFIHGFLGNTLVMSEEDAIRNEPFLSSPILYAADQGSKNMRLLAMFPERSAYLGQYDRMFKSPNLKEIKAAE